MCTAEQVFLDGNDRAEEWMTLTSFSLTNFNCSCVRHKLTSFSLTRSLVQKLAWPAFELASVAGVLCVRGGNHIKQNVCNGGYIWTRLLVKEKPVNLCCTHEQIKLVKENFVVKKTSSLLLFKPRTDDQVFLDKFFLDKEPSSKNLSIYVVHTSK